MTVRLIAKSLKHHILITGIDLAQATYHRTILYAVRQLASGCTLISYVLLDHYAGEFASATDLIS